MKAVVYFYINACQIVQVLGEKSLDQNLRCPQGEEQTYPSDVVEDESAGVCCPSSVDSKGQMVILCHVQVASCPIQGHHRALSGNGELMDGRCLPWKEEQLGLGEGVLQVVCTQPLRHVLNDPRISPVLVMDSFPLPLHV